jgi:hypothetical protein
METGIFQAMPRIIEVKKIGRPGRKNPPDLP